MNLSNYKYHCQLTDHPGNGDNTPKAYLQYLFVDDNFEYTQPAGVTPYVKMTNAAQVQFNPGVVAAHEKLSLTFDVPEDGYMYIYVATESAEDIDIFFDDFTVKHLGVDIIQRTDYYPFGSVLTHWDKELEDYRFGYQGEFSEEDEETAWNQFELRFYDPLIGRTFTIDPYRQFWSNYGWVGNNPITGIDPSGGVCPTCPDGSEYDAYRNNDAIFAYNSEVGVYSDLDAYAPGAFGTIWSGFLDFLNDFDQLIDKGSGVSIHGQVAGNSGLERNGNATHTIDLRGMFLSFANNRDINVRNNFFSKANDIISEGKNVIDAADKLNGLVEQTQDIIRSHQSVHHYPLKPEILKSRPGATAGGGNTIGPDSLLYEWRSTMPDGKIERDTFRINN